MSNVAFGQSSGYFEPPAGTIVTLFAVGDGTNPPLGVTAVFDTRTVSVSSIS